MAKFEEDLAALEEVVAQLERGDLALEESVDLFERGVKLSRACKDVLERAQSRIEALVDPESDPDEAEDIEGDVLGADELEEDEPVDEDEDGE